MLPVYEPSLYDVVLLLLELPLLLLSPPLLLPEIEPVLDPDELELLPKVDGAMTVECRPRTIKV